MNKQLKHSLRLVLSLSALLSLNSCLTVGPSLIFFDYDWNPDNSLNVELNKKVFRVNADGSSPQALSDQNRKQLFSPNQNLRLESSLRDIPVAAPYLLPSSVDIHQYETLSLAQADGLNKRQLFSLNQKQLLQAGWSPDSRQIAVLYGKIPTNSAVIDTQELSLLSAGSESPQVITPASLRGTGTQGSIQAYHWTPDSSLLVLLESTEASATQAGRLTPKSRYEIYRIKPGQAEPVSILALKLDQGRLNQMIVTNDEKQACFTNSENKLFLADLQTGIVTYLERGAHPTWSADSKSLAFTSFEPAHYPNANSEAFQITKTDLAKVDANGQNRTWLTRTPELSEMQPVWSPNGNWLAFQILDRDGREQSGVFTIRSDGQNRTKVTQSLNLATVPMPIP